MKRALIISTNAVGDTYLSASALPVLKENGFSSVDFATSSECTEMMRSLGGKDVFTLAERSSGETAKLILKMSRRKYDAAFCFFPGALNTILFRVARARVKVGFVGMLNRTEWHTRTNPLSTRGLPAKSRTWQPSESYLDRVRIPLTVALGKEVQIHKPRVDRLVTVSPQRVDTILLHLHSRKPDRQLSPRQTRALMELVHCLCPSSRILLLGENSWRETELRGSRISVEATGNLPFLALNALIQSCRTFIGVDSFPLHLADAYDVPFLGIFGRTRPESVLVNHRKSVSFSVNTLTDIDERELIEKISRQTNDLFTGKERERNGRPSW